MNESLGIEIIPNYFLFTEASLSQADHRFQATQLLVSVREFVLETPYIVDRLRFSVIYCGADADVKLPLCDLLSVGQDELQTICFSPEFRLSPALRCLKEQIQRDHAQLKADGLKMKRPIAFLFIGSDPEDAADEWRIAFHNLTSIDASPNIVPVGIGDCDLHTIHSPIHRKDGPAPSVALFITDDGDLGDLFSRLFRSMFDFRPVPPDPPAGHFGAFTEAVSESASEDFDFTWNEMDDQLLFTDSQDSP